MGTMTKKTPENNASTPQDAPTPASVSPEKQVTVNAQYIKDLSFENPFSPQALFERKQSPAVNLALDIQIHKLQEDVFEVALVIQAKAMQEEKAVFVVELSYGGVFTLKVPEQEIQPILMIYCPSLLFPFARRIIADATRDGGFLPLLLEPVDFSHLFIQHQKQRAAQQAQATGTN